MYKALLKSQMVGYMNNKKIVWTDTELPLAFITFSYLSVKRKCTLQIICNACNESCVLAIHYFYNLNVIDLLVCSPEFLLVIWKFSCLRINILWKFQYDEWYSGLNNRSILFYLREYTLKRMIYFLL